MDRFPAGNDGRAATAVVLAVAMILPSAVTWEYFVALAGAGHVNAAQQLAYSVGKTVQFGLPVAFCLWCDPKALRPNRPRFDGLALGLGFGLAVSAAMFVLYFGWLRETSVFGAAPDKVRMKLGEFGVTTPGSYFALAAFVVVAHSLLEEYYWRWFVFGRLRSLLPFVPALALSSLAFMAHHVIVLNHYFSGRFLSATVPFSLGVAVGGAAWGWLYERTGSIWSSWLSHLLIDAAIFAIGWNLVSRAAG
jgi:membrane protease YdiL (CAAX protease family)